MKNNIIKFPVGTPPVRTKRFRFRLFRRHNAPTSRRPEKFEIFFKNRAGIDEALCRFADEILKADRECKDPLFFAYTCLSAHNDALKSILEIMEE